MLFSLPWGQKCLAVTHLQASHSDSRDIKLYHGYTRVCRVLGIIFNHLSQCTSMIGICRVGDDKRTVNTSTTPHISDQLWTENACETLLCWFIVVIWALVSDNMYRYGRHLRSFHCNPTILKTVSPGGFDCRGQHGEYFFIEIQRHEIILAPMCLC